MTTEKTSANYLADFEPGYFYHVYNRTNNKEKLFFEDADRIRFLSKYWAYLSFYLHTYAYCLLGNHFHFLIQVKSMRELVNHVSLIWERDRKAAQKSFIEKPNEEKMVHRLLSGQFNRFFTAYAMYFNKAKKRSGNLFYRPFKRVNIQQAAHFTHSVFYIHANPAKHRITNDFTNYPWSSYQEFLSGKATKIERDSVLKWFGGKRAFIEYHNQGLGDIYDLLPED